MLLLLAALAACSTPRSPYPDLEEPAGEGLLTDSEANGLLQIIATLLEGLAKNT